jgi:hypothetical protein
LIGVGVRDRDYDRATVEWAVDDAVRGLDTLHVVHSYLPLRLDGCVWPPVGYTRDLRYLAATRVVAQAVQQANQRRGRRAGFDIAGSAIGGLPDDVLVELSAVVDLIVMGDDTSDPSISNKITAYVEDHAQCPVVCVPRAFRPPADERPVTVVMDELGLSEPVMEFARAFAQRHGVALQVSRAWTALHEGRLTTAAWMAEQQEELDAQLASWLSAHPGPAVSARIELDDEWPARLRAMSSLVVVPARSATLWRSQPEDENACPLAVVPI